jgi:glucokinase
MDSPVVVSGKSGPMSLYKSEFCARFEAKGRMRNYLAAIPTYVIVRPYPGLLGAAALLREG